MPLHIKIEELAPVPNICDQVVREVWRNEHMSLAHVIMDPGNRSRLHRHNSFTELYHILEGHGVLWLDGKPTIVGLGSVVPIKPGVSHKMENNTRWPLVHLVTCNPPFDPNDVILLPDPHLEQETPPTPTG